MHERFPALDIVLIESGGDNLAGTFDVMDRDARRMRKDRPFVFTNLKTRDGVDVVVDFLERCGGLAAKRRAN